MRLCPEGILKMKDSKKCATVRPEVPNPEKMKPCQDLGLVPEVHCDCKEKKMLGTGKAAGNA